LRKFCPTAGSRPEEAARVTNAGPEKLRTPESAPIIAESVYTSTSVITTVTAAGTFLVHAGFR
jgi:hypothetical protein